MFSLFQAISLRYILHHKVRAMLITLSIALGVATWVASDALQSAMNRSATESATPGTGADLYVSNDVTKWIPRDLAEDLKADPDVESAEARVILNIPAFNPPTKVDEPRRQIQARLFGIEISFPKGKPKALQDWEKLGITISTKAQQAYIIARARRLIFSKEPPPVMIGEALRKKLQLQEDPESGTMKLSLFVAGKAKEVNVVGEIIAEGTGATLGGMVIVMDGQDAAQLLEKPNQVTRFDVNVKQGANRKTVEARLRARLTSVNVQTPEAQSARVKNLIRGMEISFRICGAGALVVGMFLVFNALSISVVERRHDIGVLRSIGATRAQVRGFFVLEAAMLGVLGTIIGIPLGIALASLSFESVQSLYDGIFISVAGGQVQATQSTLITAAVGGILTSLLAALLPASQAASEEPADTVRRAPYVTGRAYRVMQIATCTIMLLAGTLLLFLKPYLTQDLVNKVSLLLCGLGLGALCIVLYHARSSLADETGGTAFPTLFFVLGLLLVAFGGLGWFFQQGLTPEKLSYIGFVLMLLGIMLATPLLTSLVTRALQPIFRAILPIAARLSADNLVRSPGRTGLVIAALTAGVAMMVQTAGTILSNEEAFAEWMDRTYRADFYVTAGGPFSSSGLLSTMKVDLQDELRDVLPTGTKTVASSYRYPNYDSSKIGPTRVFLTLIDAEAHYQVNRTIPNAVPHLELYHRLAQEPGVVMISENFSVMHGIKEGDFLSLRGAKGLLKLKVVGVVEEFVWSRGSMTLDLKQYKDVLGLHDQVDAFEVYLPAGSDVPKLKDRILKQLGGSNALVVLTRPALLESVRSILRRVYGIAYAQELLVGVVAILGVVTALLISVLGRRRELGLIRAVGGTRGQLLQTVLAEAILIGLVGTLLGVMVGIPLEHYVVRVVLFEEAGYLFPVRIPWAATGMIAAAALLCSMLAGIGPAVHAMRLKISEAIAYE